VGGDQGSDPGEDQPGTSPSDRRQTDRDDRDGEEALNMDEGEEPNQEAGHTDVEEPRSARSKTARRSTRDATTTSKPSMRVRWGSHQAKSGVYHAWSEKTGFPDSGSEVMPSKLVGWSATNPGRASRVPAPMPMPSAGWVMT